MSKEALKLALEALESWQKTCLDCGRSSEELGRATNPITAIKEALAQPEQEPVALYVYKPALPRGHLGNVSDGDLPWVYDQDPSSGYSARMLVYTTPPQRKPLTDEMRKQMKDRCDSMEMRGAFADGWMSSEAAHGIKEKNNG